MNDNLLPFQRLDVYVAAKELVLRVHEANIRDTIARFGLLPDAVLVSWLPGVLLRFNALSPQTKLCFSHLPMARLPWLYPIAKVLSSIVERTALSLKPGLRDILPRLANEALSSCLHFHDNGDPLSGRWDDEKAHCNPGHVVPGTLTGTMLDLLRKTDGMVCVPVGLATPELRRGHRSQGLGLAVYSVDDMPSLERVMADIDPDIIYVDNADIIYRAAAPQTMPQSLSAQARARS